MCDVGVQCFDVQAGQKRRLRKIEVIQMVDYVQGVLDICPGWPEATTQEDRGHSDDGLRPGSS